MEVVITSIYVYVRLEHFLTSKHTDNGKRN